MAALGWGDFSQKVPRGLDRRCTAIHACRPGSGAAAPCPCPLPPPYTLRPTSPAERFTIPKGLRDDVLPADVNGPGHLAARFNPAACDCGGFFDAKDDMDCIDFVHSVINIEDPTLPQKEKSHLVYTIVAAIANDDDMVADSLEEVWTRLLYGWSALLAATHLPGWAAQLDPCTGRYVPGPQLCALADLTAATLGNAEYIDMVSTVAAAPTDALYRY
jgi:hypothetical protein